MAKVACSHSSWAATWLVHSKPNYHLLDCARCREELRHWLETTAAGLPCNLPQQLQHLTHAASSSSSAHAGKEQGPVTRRDMLALLPARTVNKVSNVWGLSAACSADSLKPCKRMEVHQQRMECRTHATRAKQCQSRLPHRLFVGCFPCVQSAWQ